MYHSKDLIRKVRFIFILFLVLVLFAPKSFAAEPAAAKPAAMDEFIWKNRLIIFTNISDKEKEKVKIELEKLSPEIKDREILIGYFYSEKPSYIDKYKIAQKAVLKLINTSLKTDRSSSVLLIGKDGGIKFKGPYNTQLKKILAQIDSMPMRIREIEDKN